MLGCVGLFRAVIAISLKYLLEQEEMQLRKDNVIPKPTCYICLYFSLILSYTLVKRTRAAAATKINILSFFEATRIWPLNLGKVLIRQSPNITRFESLPVTPTPLLSATPRQPRQPRAICILARSALYIVTRQSPSSLNLMAVIVQLGL